MLNIFVFNKIFVRRLVFFSGMLRLLYISSVIYLIGKMIRLDEYMNTIEEESGRKEATTVGAHTRTHVTQGIPTPPTSMKNV